MLGRAVTAMQAHIEDIAVWAVKSCMLVLEPKADVLVPSLSPRWARASAPLHWFVVAHRSARLQAPAAADSRRLVETVLPHSAAASAARLTRAAALPSDGVAGCRGGADLQPPASPSH